MSEAESRRGEFVPDHAQITLERKKRRIDDECARRIAGIFPLQDQIAILAACLMRIMGTPAGSEIRGVTSAAYHLERDRARAADMLRCISEHRHAAEALKVYCARNPASIAAIDVSAAKYWPAMKGPHNED